MRIEIDESGFEYQIVWMWELCLIVNVLTNF